VPEAPAPVEAALIIALVILVAERVAVEMVLLPLPVEAAETEGVTEAVLLPVIAVVERIELLTDAADALDEADTLDETEAEAEAEEEMADRLPPLREIWPE